MFFVLTACVGPRTTLSGRWCLRDAVLSLSFNLSSHAGVDGTDDVSSHTVAMFASVLGVDGVSFFVVDSVLEAAGFRHGLGNQSGRLFGAKETGEHETILCRKIKKIKFLFLNWAYN